MKTSSTNVGASTLSKGGLSWFRSLRARLLISVNLVVALMVVGALMLDYRNELRMELSAYRSALSDEARALLPGVLELKHHGDDVVQRYIDAVCATMQADSSPGHHIVVDLEDTTIQAQSHHRASKAILERVRSAAASPDGQSRIGGVPLVVGAASNGKLRAYVSEDSEPVISRIRHQAFVRFSTLAGIGVAGALLVNLILMRLVTRPVDDLVRVVRQIGAGDLGVRPKSFTTEELDVLATEIGRMSSDLEHRDRDRATHLKKAQRLQAHLLPDLAHENDKSVAVVYRPADTIAGDYYDILDLADGSTLVCVTDVCGHGVPAAMGAAILKTLLLSACERFTSPPDILKHINGRFLKVSLPEDFASMVLIRVEPSSGLLEYASAGHEPSYVLRDSGEVEQFGSTGMLLGISDDAKWKSLRITLSSPDRLVLLTDGVTEAADSDGRHFGRKTVIDLLKTLRARPVDEIVDTIISSLDLHCADVAVGDDQTILVLQPHVTSIKPNRRSSIRSDVLDEASS